MLQGGSTYLTADAIAGSSGARTRVFSISILSGGTGGIVSLRNGTSTSDTIYATLTCTAVSTSNIFDFGPSGMFFPNGCFVDIISNVTSLVINFAQE